MKLKKSTIVLIVLAVIFPWSLCSINKVFCNKNDHSNR